MCVGCCKPSTRTCIFQRNQKTTKTKDKSTTSKIYCQTLNLNNAPFLNKIICLLKLFKLLNFYLRIRNRNLKDFMRINNYQLAQDFCTGGVQIL